MAYIVGDYHRGMVVNYYMTLLTQFGPTSLLKHLPQLKKLVWTEAGLALIESHKQKKEKQEWAA